MHLNQAPDSYQGSKAYYYMVIHGALGTPQPHTQIMPVSETKPVKTDWPAVVQHLKRLGWSNEGIGRRTGLDVDTIVKLLKHNQRR